MYLFALLKHWFENWLENEEGQSLVEYALILVLIALVVVTSLTAISPEINLVFIRVVDALRGP